MTRPPTLPGLVAALALSAPLSAGTWVVDAGGGGDFTDLQAAIDAAAPGDVLLIHPIAGLLSYGDVLVGKPLDLIGQPGAFDPPRIDSLDVQAAAGITLFALDIDKLRLQGVPGAAVIDACEIGGGSSWPGGPDWPGIYAKFVVEGCADVRLMRCAIEGSEFAAVGRTAMLVRGASRVQLVSSLVRGADVYESPPFSGWGGDGLEVRDTSLAWVAASHVIGGHGDDYWELGFLAEAGRGGDGVVVGESARVDIRGSTSHMLRAGLQDGLGFDSPAPAPFDGFAVDCAASVAAVVTVSGPSPEGPLGGCASLAPAQLPFLSLGNPVFAAYDLGPFGGPGQPRTAELSGEAAATAVLIASLGLEQSDVPALVTTPLWIQLGLAVQVTAVSLAGVDLPTSFSWLQPTSPAFAGFELHVQAFQLLPAPNYQGTNACALVLSF